MLPRVPAGRLKSALTQEPGAQHPIVPTAQPARIRQLVVTVIRTPLRVLMGRLKRVPPLEPGVLHPTAPTVMPVRIPRRVANVIKGLPNAPAAVSKPVRQKSCGEVQALAVFK